MFIHKQPSNSITVIPLGQGIMAVLLVNTKIVAVRHMEKSTAKAPVTYMVQAPSGLPVLVFFMLFAW